MKSIVCMNDVRFRFCNYMQWCKDTNYWCSLQIFCSEIEEKNDFGVQAMIKLC